MKDAATIAIVPSYGLGDGLLFLVLAQNLANQGFKVTVFHDVIAPLSHLMCDFTVSTCPHDLQALLQFDFVIAEKATKLAVWPDAAEKVAFISMSSLPAHLKTNHPEALLSRVVDEAKKKHLRPLLNGAGVSIKHHYRGEAAAIALKKYCRDFLKLDEPALDVHLNLPQRQVDTKRVCFHPTSSKRFKDWPQRKFLRLAEKLSAKNIEPAFILTPKVRAAWRASGVPETWLPAFSGLDEVMVYLQQAVLLVGNDSGIGHLASLVGVPTITLSYIKNPHYFWRPAGAENELLSAVWYFKWFGRPIWQPFLTVRRVYHHVLAQLSKK